MAARNRNQKVENPSRQNGAEKATVVRDRQKPRFYGKTANDRAINKKITLALYKAVKGIFFSDRKTARIKQAENVQMKWELRISTLLG